MYWNLCSLLYTSLVFIYQWHTEGGGVQPPTPEIPKALQNRAKLNPIVKTVKNCWIWDANTPISSEKRQ